MTHTKDEAKAATPHHDLIAELLNPNTPKTEREHAASREIERLQALAVPTVHKSVAETEIDIYAGHCGTIYSEVFLPVGTKLYTTPPAAQPAAQEFVCSTGLCHYKAVPDALTSADIQEHIEYVAGWNDCRQAMLEMMK